MFIFIAEEMVDQCRCSRFVPAPDVHRELKNCVINACITLHDMLCMKCTGVSYFQFDSEELDVVDIE
jgi:hypothetical protein